MIAVVTVLDPALERFARAVVREALGAGELAGLEALQPVGVRAVLRVTIARPSRRLVLKIAGVADQAVDFERTAAVSAVARAAGVPAPAVLAADNSGRSGPWRFLLQEHVEGVAWRRVRPLLDPGQLAAAHGQIAAAVLAVHSVGLNAFGELDSRGRAARGGDVIEALHHRAELRIAAPRSRDAFHRLLDRDAHLFAGVSRPALCHDDLHHRNLLFQPRRGGDWQLAAVLDWDKAWAGPTESDIARMAFWDDMTGPEFWAVYRETLPLADGEADRAPHYQLLWCLEYDNPSARHLNDTTALRRQLGLS